MYAGYKLIEVDGGNLSGYLQSKVVVDIGYGDREYWAFTNEHGQLIRSSQTKLSLKMTIPNLSHHPVDTITTKQVLGMERADWDEGHIIADSLGGLSNAYNITPQDSTLNRHGEQAYMEDAIRKAGGATNFEAIITYPNTSTQIPSRYQFTYTIRGNKVVDTFDNLNPDKVNESMGLTGSQSSSSSNTNSGSSNTTAKGDLASVETNGNGIVTIKEAKDAGYSMPITRDHWLYQYMRDNDNDGMIGE